MKANISGHKKVLQAVDMLFAEGWSWTGVSTRRIIRPPGKQLMKLVMNWF